MFVAASPILFRHRRKAQQSKKEGSTCKRQQQTTSRKVLRRLLPASVKKYLARYPSHCACLAQLLLIRAAGPTRKGPFFRSRGRKGMRMEATDGRSAELSSTALNLFSSAWAAASYIRRVCLLVACSIKHKYSAPPRSAYEYIGYLLSASLQYRRRAVNTSEPFPPLPALDLQTADRHTELGCLPAYIRQAHSQIHARISLRPHTHTHIHVLAVTATHNTLRSRARTLITAHSHLLVTAAASA